MRPGRQAVKIRYHEDVNHYLSHAATVTDDPAPAIAREGWEIVFVFFLVAIGCSVGAYYGGGVWWAVAVGALLMPVAVWSAWFFRDPPRRIPSDPLGVISPADGLVCMIARVSPPKELGISAEATRGMTRVSVFMSVFNVHVNRSPMGGKILRIAYHPGKFFNARLDKASEHNERCSYAMSTPDGRPLVWVQIAGLIARRIVCRVKEGDELRPGERFGLIKFGSRLDVYLPEGVEPLVKVGDRSVAGETVLARVPAARMILPVVSESVAAPGAQAGADVGEVQTR